MSGSTSSQANRRNLDDIELWMLLERGMWLGVVAWPMFGLVDLYWATFAFKSARIDFMLSTRLILEPFHLAIYFAARRRAFSYSTGVKLLWLQCMSYAFGVGLQAWELGALRSGYLYGVCAIFVALPSIVPTNWKRSAAINGLLLLSYLSALGIGGLWSPAIRAQWQDPQAIAVLGGNLMLTIGIAILGFVQSHQLFALRHQIYEARRLGKYLLRRKLGEGGMNEVWLAWDPGTKAEVALKILRRSASDTSTLRRFDREARSTAALASPNTVRILDYGASEDGIYFFAMEYLRGPTLDTVLRSLQRLSPALAIFLVRQICSSLQEAHRKGIVHRDIKPGNVMIVAQAGQTIVKVLDFGIARLRHAPADENLTSDGAAVGTPAYMAPEAFHGGALTERADIYSIGATLYHMICGSPPFVADDLASYAEAHGRTPVLSASIRNPEVDATLDALLLRCLAKNAAERFASCADLLAAFDALSYASPSPQEALALLDVSEPAHEEEAATRHLS